MKDSGVDWIREIPKEWKIERNKNCFSCSKEIVGDKWEETQLLSLTTKGIKKKSYDDITGKVPDDFGTYQTVELNDNVMCLFDLDVSAVFSGISPYKGMISPAYKVLKTKENMNPKFADYWFMYVFDERKFKTYSKNIRYTLNYDEFATLPIVCPKIKEQSEIVTFLDKKVSEIDNAIEKTKQSIEEYKKLKQSVIFDTFNSMGNVKRYKLRHLGELKNGLNFHDVTSDITIKMLGVGDFKNYMILDSEVLFSELPIGDEPIPEDLLLQSGDIVFVRSNGSKELVGRSVLVDNVSYPLTFSGFCIRFRNTQQSLVLNQYLLYFFRSEKFKEILKLSSFGTNISNLSQDTLNAVRVPVPPIGDQLQIINMLKTKCAAFDGVIERKQQLLKELEQYKKSLIYEYVTGKKEVA